jgi:vancomycin permeability regulator SanA
LKGVENTLSTAQPSYQHNKMDVLLITADNKSNQTTQNGLK